MGQVAVYTALERKKAPEGTYFPFEAFFGIEPLTLNFNGITFLYDLSHSFHQRKSGAG
jgi:hypothetical protein